MEARKKGLPIWFQVTLPIVTAIIGIVVGWLLDIPTTTFQRRIQKASNDMQRVQVIMEIIDKADPDYLPMLDSLIMTIEDVEIKEAMSWIVETKRRTLEHSKTRVEEKSEPIRKELESSEPSAEEAKPDDTTCVIVYYAGDSCSEMDVQTVKAYFETLKTSLFNSFLLIPKDSVWFNERAGFKVNPEVIDTGTTAKILMNPTLEEKKERWVYFRIKEGLYVHDASKGWVRHDTLALNRPGSKVTFADIQPGVKKAPADLLEKYAILLVLPPYPFYTRAQ